LRGVAQSSTRVSALMRKIDASEWLADPEVERVQTTDVGSSRQSEFILYLKQANPTDEDEMEGL
ncbi:MAG: PilN domain-containing protein, partial [Planctomycetes bacterium]|nr:PilN domain-containing protein [Planctomycetota bacterium]